MRTPSLLFVLACTACSTTKSPPPAVAPPEPIALVVVFEANWGWIGNELYTQDVDLVQVGAYMPLRIALDTTFAELPRGSQTAIVSYAHDAIVLAPLGPVERATSAVLGPQSSYEQYLVADAARGIAVGIEQLAQSPLRRKLLIVIGDGTQSDHDHASEALGAQRTAAERAHVVTGAIVWKNLQLPIAIDRWTDTVWDAYPWEIVERLRQSVRSTKV